MNDVLRERQTRERRERRSLGQRRGAQVPLLGRDIWRPCCGGSHNLRYLSETPRRRKLVENGGDENFTRAAYGGYKTPKKISGEPSSFHTIPTMRGFFAGSGLPQ